ncbi:MAG TPA: hypothetical protein VKA92_13045 [Segetibacter sp.]|nr:hypothetical protein [Segetibacter sp.]
MSFLKNILKPFVDFNQENENEGSTKESTLQQKNVIKEKVSIADNVENVSAVNTTTATAPPYTPSQATNSSNSSASNDYNKYFENLIEEANAKIPMFQGTDFKEFIDSKIDVEAIADEDMRYKTAFNVLKRTGLTKEKLVTTGQEYIKLIDQDLKGFTDAYNQQYKADVETQEQLLQRKAEELQALNDKISALNQEMKQMSEQVVQNKEKLSSNKNAFISAGEEKKNEIQMELQKINQYF